MTIEGAADILRLVSSVAPRFEDRVAAVGTLTRLGIRAIVRSDPVFPHLFEALYQDAWFEEVVRLVEVFAGAGARHIVAKHRQAFTKSPQAWQPVWAPKHVGTNSQGD